MLGPGSLPAAGPVKTGPEEAQSHRSVLGTSAMARAISRVLWSGATPLAGLMACCDGGYVCKALAQD